MAFGEVTGKEMKQDREYSITDEMVIELAVIFEKKGNKDEE